MNRLGDLWICLIIVSQYLGNLVEFGTPASKGSYASPSILCGILNPIQHLHPSAIGTFSAIRCLAKNLGSLSLCSRSFPIHTYTTPPGPNLASPLKHVGILKALFCFHAFEAISSKPDIPSILSRPGSRVLVRQHSVPGSLISRHDPASLPTCLLLGHRQQQHIPTSLQSPLWHETAVVCDSVPSFCDDAEWQSHSLRLGITNLAWVSHIRRNLRCHA